MRHRTGHEVLWLRPASEIEISGLISSEPAPVTLTDLRALAVKACKVDKERVRAMFGHKPITEFDEDEYPSLKRMLEDIIGG